jgi:hypothetical protein
MEFSLTSKRRLTNFIILQDCIENQDTLDKKSPFTAFTIKRARVQAPILVFVFFECNAGPSTGLLVIQQLRFRLPNAPKKIK